MSSRTKPTNYTKASGGLAAPLVKHADVSEYLSRFRHCFNCVVHGENTALVGILAGLTVAPVPAMALVTDTPYSNVTFRIIGCALRVHTAVGPGMLEDPYKLALAAEMLDVGLRFETEVRLPFRYRARVLGNAYLMDFVVEDLVVIEAKAVAQLLPVHRAQLTSYLKLSGHPAGLLLNFNVASMSEGIVRVLNDRPGPRDSHT